MLAMPWSEGGSWQQGWQDGWQDGGWQDAGWQGSSSGGWQVAGEDVQWRDVPCGFDPQQTRDHRDILRFMYQVSAKGKGKSFPEWTRQWREARRASERCKSNAREGRWQTLEPPNGAKMWRWTPKPPDTTYGWRRDSGRSSEAEAVERAAELTREMEAEGGKGKGKAEEELNKGKRKGKEEDKEEEDELFKGKGKGKDAREYVVVEEKGKGKNAQAAGAKGKGKGQGKDDGWRPINVVAPKAKAAEAKPKVKEPAAEAEEKPKVKEPDAEPKPDAGPADLEEKVVEPAG